MFLRFGTGLERHVTTVDGRSGWRVVHVRSGCDAVVQGPARCPLPVCYFFFCTDASEEG